MTLRTPPAGLILTPGASADRDHETLVALEAGLPEIAVRRLTLGTTSVPRAVDKIVAEAEALADELGVAADQIALGGRSFGGRACSVAVAEGLPASTLLLLSYPLHPPGKPDKLRTDHFLSLSVPCLFVSGLKDPFGTPDEFTEHVQAIEGPVSQEWVVGGHSPKNKDGEILEYVRSHLGLD